ncbi:MAG: hypothetical protein HQ539_01015 [Parcubacteria group bacterium]|nr:hypothetical protein [Parcubacteria group bacterium]
MPGQDLRSLIKGVLARHPGSGELLETSEEDRREIMDIWTKGAKELEPKLKALRQQRMQSLSRARHFFIGSSEA